jgi:hypothetical protein
MLVPDSRLLIDCPLPKKAELRRSGLISPFLEETDQDQHKRFVRYL